MKLEDPQRQKSPLRCTKVKWKQTTKKLKKVKVNRLKVECEFIQQDRHVLLDRAYQMARVATGLTGWTCTMRWGVMTFTVESIRLVRMISLIVVYLISTCNKKKRCFHTVFLNHHKKNKKSIKAPNHHPHHLFTSSHPSSCFDLVDVVNYDSWGDQKFHFFLLVVVSLFSEKKSK